MEEDKVLEIAKARDAKKAEQRQPEQQPYKIAKGAICRVKSTADEYQEIPLCNFNARITKEVIRDDGAEVDTTFAIEGSQADGRPLPQAEVSAKDYNSMSWVTAAWGARAVIYAGNGTKDHLRAAIQLLSGEPERHYIYAHIGWRKIGGKWVYLHSGGAIGTGEPIEVDAGDRLANYSLPKPPAGEELKQAINSSLELLALAKPEITYPLLAAIYRAPLGEVLPIDLSVFIAGPTGAQKSELTAIAQAHWGAGFTGKTLPANWASTGNSLEKLAFLAKDAILAVDDFAPHGTSVDIQRYHKDADRVLRAQGNISGRMRMAADRSLKQPYYPRGLIISSGEDIPHGQSLNARMLILEMNRGDVNLEELTAMQQHAAAGHLATAMAGYIAWLAPQVDELKQTLRPKKDEYRTLIRQQCKVAHDRIPDNIASLLIGLEQFLRYATDSGAITASDAKDMFDAGMAALMAAANAQAQYQQSEDPTERFISLISAAVTTGQAHIADAKTGDAPPEATHWGWERDTGTGYKAKGMLIGWLDGDNLLLEAEASYGMAQHMARDQGTTIPIGQKTLWRRMQQKGLLLSYEEGRLKQRWYVAGTQKRLIHISKTLLADATSPENKSTTSVQNSEVDLNRGLQTAENGHVSPVSPVSPEKITYKPKNFFDDEASF